MATNREWLYSLDVADLADWFDSEHVEDAISENLGLSQDFEIDTQDSEIDTREKLEADVHEFVFNDELWFTGMMDDEHERFIRQFIDRQESITERECCKYIDGAGCDGPEVVHGLNGRIAELQAKVTDLQIQLEAMSDVANDYRFERDELKRQLDTMRDVAREFRDERDAWHERFDKANREKCDLQSRDMNQRHNNLLNRLREKGVCVRWDDSRSDYTVLLANCDEARELQERVDTLTRYIHDIKQIARKV